MLINQQKWQKLPEAACILNVVAQNILLLFLTKFQLLSRLPKNISRHNIQILFTFYSLWKAVLFPEFKYFLPQLLFSVFFILFVFFFTVFSSLFLPLPEKYTCIRLYIIKLYSFSQISHTHFNYSILFFRHLRILHFGILRNWEWALIINEHIKFHHSSVFFNHVLLSLETSPDEVPF